MARRKLGMLITMAPVCACAGTLFHVAKAGDPGVLSDYVLPENNVSRVDGTFFTYTGMRDQGWEYVPEDFKVLKASMGEFPALNGQSVSYAVLRFPAGGFVGPPHIHPRASELFFLLDGTLQVGFVDGTNKLFAQTIQVGDMFVFPKGLVHFQYNNDTKAAALAVSVFGSASPGSVSVPTTVFNSTIGDGILARSFKTNVANIQKIKVGFATKG